MVKAKKNLFREKPDKNEMAKNKQIVTVLIEKLREKLSKKEDAQKAALILEQWIHESKEIKQEKEKSKKSA